MTVASHPENHHREHDYPEHYLSSNWTLRGWLLTVDHKRIAWLYTVSITGFFFLGGIAALLIRLELITAPGDLLSAKVYNEMFSLHGIVMVWFFLIPSIPATLGNFLMPMMVGAKDMAFPKLNLLSWYIYTVGGIFTLAAVLAGGVDTGWTFYTPYSSLFSNTSVIAAATGVFVVGFSSILTGLNFMVTTHTMRAPGLTWKRLPLFVWANYATGLIMVLATPVLSVTLLLMGLERGLGIGIFDPALGGDPLLFQHLFWFYSHPAVYIMILPAMGVVSEIIACFSRNPVFGYKGMVLSIAAIALFGFVVWGHHMFVSGQSLYSGILFSFFTFLVAVPSAVKTLNWTATMFRGRIWFSAPMIYALSFLGLFTIGGLTGVFLASLALDVHLHDTYFVTAHFHYIMVGGAVTAYLGGLHFWWPKMTGRMYSELWSKVAALALFIGFNLTFYPQFLLGYSGMPRRYHAYPEAFEFLHVLSSLGAGVLAIGYLLPLAYLAWSLWKGPRAPANPWDAYGLEWRANSPPIEHNFTETPRVTGGPYAYD
ncbi:cytochrome c oxidase subunit I [Marinobacter nanhaiticus D15-8W]|uniref:Cytochrome c oxidase subunit I n=1 Tax=Marinobacter nanhaiticus D15-8W TaxID=626887 RepID=N6WW20_9GAMM|nr:cbb3-type cytochrome c oxidase subunit I [Marinobacter nanhaiticus]ENO13043.1 cytochrome c oxidase subunit I [Marinobacter nanhaiticus D15-8W]BES70398.1 cytochrome c oxidase subunit I [Marinobacter nanhaiticus D15-8W]